MDQVTEAVAQGWPSPVRACVSDVVGPVRRTEVLAGLSGRQVTRVNGDRGSVVVKGPAATRELEFYRHVAPVLEGVPVPRLHGGFDVAGSAWLVLELVAAPLPTSRWTGEASMYAVLARLHTTSPAALAGLTAPFVPHWTADLTERAGAVVGLGLGPWQDEAQEWLSGDVPISGDANPRNWAVREDGTFVLLDWERAGRGGVAVDVATTIPGLPSGDEAATVAAAYSHARAQAGSPVTGDDLVRGLRLAKLWTAVELLGETRDHDGLHQTQRWLAAALPGWLASW